MLLQTLQVCEKIITLLNDMYPLAQLDLEYSLPKIKSGYLGDDIDLITSDPEAAKAYAAKKDERLAAAAADAAAASAAAAAVPTTAPVANPHQTLVRTPTLEPCDVLFCFVLCSPSRSFLLLPYSSVCTYRTVPVPYLRRLVLRRRRKD